MKYLRSKMFPLLLLVIILSSFGHHSGAQDVDKNTATAGNKNNSDTKEAAQFFPEMTNSTANNNNNNTNNMNDGNNSTGKRELNEIQQIVTKKFSNSDVSSYRHSGYSNLHNRQCYLVLLVYIVNKEFKGDLATYDIDLIPVAKRNEKFKRSLKILHEYSLRILRVLNHDMKLMFSDKLWKLHSKLTDFVEVGSPVEEMIGLARDIIKRGEKYNLWHTEKETDILLEFRFKPTRNYVINGYNICSVALGNLAGASYDIERDLFEEYGQASEDYSVTKDFGSVLFLMTKKQFDSLKNVYKQNQKRSILLKTIEMAFMEALDVLIKKFYAIPDMKQITTGNMLYTSMLIVLRSLYLSVANLSQTLYMLSATKGEESRLFATQSYRQFIDLFQVKWLSIFDALDGWTTVTSKAVVLDDDKSAFIEDGKVVPSLIKYYTALNDSWTNLLPEKYMDPTLVYLLEIYAWMKVLNHNINNMLVVEREKRKDDHTWSKGFIIGGVTSCLKFMTGMDLLGNPPETNIDKSLWDSINKDKEFMNGYLYRKEVSDETGDDETNE